MMPPIEKLLSPLGDCMGRPIVLHMHTLLEQSYLTQTNVNKLILPAADKPDLNFQKIHTHGQSSGHIHIQSEIINYIRTALSFIFQHSKKVAKYKYVSNCKIAFTIKTSLEIYF